MDDIHTEKSNSSEITLNDVMTSYRRYARVYDQLFGFSLEDGRVKLLNAVHRLAPLSILEMGVGTGLLLPRYPVNAAVVGVDISRHMLDQAQQRVHRHGLTNVTLQQQDCESLNFPNETFDCVVLPYVLSVTPNPAQLLAEALRTCKPEGRVLAVNHFSGSPFWAWIERLASPLAAKIGFRSAFSIDQILSSRMHVEDIESANLFGLSKVLIIRRVP